MITETAIVVSIENNQTWVETQRKSVCGQCSASKGCGTSVLSKVIGNKLSKIRAINNVDAQVGDKVVIGLNEQSMLKGAFMTYMLPLMFMFLFSLIGQAVSVNLQVQSNELLVIIFAVAGLLLGLRQVKAFSSSIAKDENYQPVILKKSNSSIHVNL